MAFSFPPLPTPALNRDRKTLGASWVRFLREMYRLRVGQGAFLDGGQLIESVSLTPFVDNTISHTLGRAPKAWIPVRDQGVKCSLQVRQASVQSIDTGGSAKKIQYDTAVYDEGGDFDTATNYNFTAPVAGLYEIYHTGGLTAVNAANVQLFIHKNDSVLWRGVEQVQASTSSFNVMCYNHATVRLVAGDTIDGRIYHDDGAARDFYDGANTARLEIRLVKERWDDQDNNSTPESTLVLRTTYAHTVSLLLL